LAISPLPSLEARFEPSSPPSTLNKQIPRTSPFLILFYIFFLTGLLQAAPLFPDVPDPHWAGDAVAALAAAGLVEGYPDGTFKGDRAVSRWELAQIVARLLSRMENEESSFAHRAELEQVQALARELRPELEALSVRVDVLETNTKLLDQRVEELERISFYGTLDTRVVFQSFQNNGSGDNDSGRQGGGQPGSVPYIDYNSAVGSRVAPPWRPMLVGVFPVVDYRNGKALTNGTGFTSLAILGVNVKVNEDIDATAEFAAFSSQGDQIVDAYWGVSAPYLQNIFTANAGSGQSLDNQPYTRMTLNRFWVYHKPSNTKLTVGYIDHTDMDSLVYAGQGNLGVFGPRRFPGYGFDVTGESGVGEGKLGWEVMGTRFGDGVRFEDTNYQNYVLNGNLRYKFENGGVGAFFSRMAEEAPTGGQPLVVGLDSGINVPYGASRGWSVRQWVNPPGWFALQRSAQEQAQTASLPNTADTRPISGWNPSQDNAIGYGPGAGNFGPESQSIWGLNGHYDLAFNDREKLKFEAHFARSDFRPNRNSSYSAEGQALTMSADGTFLNDNLNLGLSYLRIDPRYAPSAWFGNGLGGRPIKPFNFTGVFHLHDSGKYPQNRQGFRLTGSWKFDEKNGEVWGKANFLQQTKTSLYDVRVLNGALGASIPTQDVIGFSPGFVDPVFFGFAHPNIYGPNSGNSFTTALSPLENPRGFEKFYEIGALYRWDGIGLTARGAASRNRLRRDSQLSAALGGSQNEVDVTVDSWSVDLGYEASDKITVSGGVDYVDATGHFDPGGLYNSFATATGSTNFENLSSYQVIPHASVDVELNSNTTWNVTGRHYGTHDRVNTAIQPGNPSLGQIGSTSNPFEWEGWQVSSEFKLNF
jgi:S-layer family protein